MLWFDQLQRRQLAAFSTQRDSRADWLRRLDAIYLYGTIGHEAVLHRDGSVHVWSADQWPDSEEVTEHVASPEERLGALVLGSERYPTLTQLLPARPSAAPDCVRCGASGRIMQAIICPDCHGLGWTAQ